MANDDETTLLIKLPRDLKTAFAGLCSGRKVSVSEELRRFMADELVSAVSGMSTKDKSNNNLTAKKITVAKTAKKQSKANTDDQPARCSDTDDMFDDSSEVARREQIRANIEAKRQKRIQAPQKNAVAGKFKLSDDVMNGIHAKDKRKSSKK